MAEFFTTEVRAEPGKKEGDPATLETRERLDIVAAKAKGLLKFVKAIRPTQYGDAIELESRADALKAVSSIQKGALDTLAKIHGLDEQVSKNRPGLADLAALLRLIPKTVLAEMHRARMRQLQGAPIDVAAREVS